MPQTAGQIFKDLVIKLTGIYDSSEAKAISYLLLEEKFDIPKSIVLLDKEIMQTDEDIERLVEYTERLKNHEPIQHILGKGDFFGRKFRVTRDVLVPRQETEELVARIIKDNRRKEGLRILDIGTGSGNIIISLGLDLDVSELHAWDISTQALIVAEENAHSLGVNVFFATKDIFKVEKEDHEFDIIVSNPPYVKTSEKLKMKKNVLKFDPPEALFVPNDDPLKFYKKIGEFALAHLAPKGRLYFEINETMGDETADLIYGMGFSKVKLIKDLNDKDRFISAIKGSI